MDLALLNHSYTSTLYSTFLIWSRVQRNHQSYVQRKSHRVRSYYQSYCSGPNHKPEQPLKRQRERERERHKEHRDAHRNIAIQHNACRVWRLYMLQQSIHYSSANIQTIHPQWTPEFKSGFILKSSPQTENCTSVTLSVLWWAVKIGASEPKVSSILVWCVKICFLSSVICGFWHDFKLWLDVSCQKCTFYLYRVCLICKLGTKIHMTETFVCANGFSDMVSSSRHCWLI